MAKCVGCAFQQSKIGDGIIINQDIIKSCWKENIVETTGSIDGAEFGSYFPSEIDYINNTGE